MWPCPDVVALENRRSGVYALSSRSARGFGSPGAAWASRTSAASAKLVPTGTDVTEHQSVCLTVPNGARRECHSWMA
jgi:hypothetical protein